MVLRALLIIGAGIGFAAASAATPAAAPPAAGATLQLAPCRLEQPQGLSSVAAECGTLRVPENPAQPQGRQIELYVARVAAVSQRKAADPLFVLAGGPGMGATVFYASVAPAFARIQRERDIVLVDQRGTGHSNPLQCEFDDEELAVVDPAEVAKLSRRCLGELAKANDVSMFTTSVAVRDLDAVRAALGYERIDLYGGSYGTRVAQHYARRYPRAHARADPRRHRPRRSWCSAPASPPMRRRRSSASSRAAVSRAPAARVSTIRSATTASCARSSSAHR